MHQNINPEESNKDLIKIRQKVLKRLGRPKNLMKVEVIEVWEKTYRINVWISYTSDKGIAKKNEICDSFFAKVTENGTLKTNPKITKKY